MLIVLGLHPNHDLDAELLDQLAKGDQIVLYVAEVKRKDAGQVRYLKVRGEVNHSRPIVIHAEI